MSWIYWLLYYHNTEKKNVTEAARFWMAKHTNRDKVRDELIKTLYYKILARRHTHLSTDMPPLLYFHQMQSQVWLPCETHCIHRRQKLYSGLHRVQKSCLGQQSTSPFWEYDTAHIKRIEAANFDWQKKTNHVEQQNCSQIYFETKE